MNTLLHKHEITCIALKLFVNIVHEILHIIVFSFWDFSFCCILMFKLSSHSRGVMERIAIYGNIARCGDVSYFKIAREELFLKFWFCQVCLCKIVFCLVVQLTRDVRTTLYER